MGNLFELGRIVATPGVLEQLTQEEIIECIERHSRGEWGSVPPEDVAENEKSLKAGHRLLSAYDVRGIKVWVITEAVSSSDETGALSRASTCLLLPSEY